MPSPFPGMDPYLEDPAHWPNVHHGIISEIQAHLNRHIRPRYVACVEERTYRPEADDPALGVFVPDVRVATARQRGLRPRESTTITEPEVVVTLLDDFREGRVELVETATRNVVTVIEVLSPSNKLRGSAGRRSFVEKRDEVMHSPVHWVEIDLLRGISGLDPRVWDRLQPHDYSVHVSPADLRPQGRVWPIQLEDPLPTIGIPLRSPDPDAPLDLQGVLSTAYDRAAYDLTVDYTRPPVPPLSRSQAKWATALLAKRK